ncbi:MAG TPA: hypothetical protein VKS60_24500 [Stellaceae bacterium]|nr:hypothetical protein [Stellaceae bacterium]
MPWNSAAAIGRSTCIQASFFLVPSVRRAGQVELFGAALDDVDRDADLINIALDVLYEGDEIVVRRYPLP